MNPSHQSPWHRPAPPSTSSFLSFAAVPQSRREFLWRSGGGLGGIALASLLGGEKLLAADPAPRSAFRVPHFPPRAKRVIQLFMGGAASHLDLFDYKPELLKRDGQKSDFGEHVEAFQDGLGPWMKPVWPFQPHGQSGKMLGETVAELVNKLKTEAKVI